MKSTKKNFTGLKSIAGLALRCGCNSYGFRRIGVINPLLEVVFVFNKELKAMSYFQLLTRVFDVPGVYRKQSFSGDTRFYLVIVSLPDQFRIINPLNNKLHLKSLKSFVGSLGSLVQIGKEYNHPHLKLKNAITTNFEIIN